MKFVVKRYFSGYSTYEIDAEDENTAYEMAKNMPVHEDKILATLEDWEESDKVAHYANCDTSRKHSNC